MKKILWVTLILAVATAAPFRAGHADQDDEASRRWRIAERDKFEARINRMEKPLQLTDTQKANLKAAYEDRLSRLSAHRQVYLQGIRDADNAAESRVLGILTPDQQRQYMDIRDRLDREDREQDAERKRSGADGY